MPKVVRPPPENWAQKQVECRSCGATIGYNTNEIRSYHGRDISGGPDGKEWIDCAHCGCQIVLRAW